MDLYGHLAPRLQLVRSDTSWSTCGQSRHLRRVLQRVRRGRPHRATPAAAGCGSRAAAGRAAGVGRGSPPSGTGRAGFTMVDGTRRGRPSRTSARRRATGRLGTAAGPRTADRRRTRHERRRARSCHRPELPAQPHVHHGRNCAHRGGRPQGHEGSCMPGSVLPEPAERGHGLWSVEESADGWGVPAGPFPCPTVSAELELRAHHPCTQNRRRAGRPSGRPGVRLLGERTWAVERMVPPPRSGARCFQAPHGGTSPPCTRAGPVLLPTFLVPPFWMVDAAYSSAPGDSAADAPFLPLFVVPPACAGSHLRGRYPPVFRESGWAGAAVHGPGTDPPSRWRAH